MLNRLACAGHLPLNRVVATFSNLSAARVWMKKSLKRKPHQCE